MTWKGLLSGHYFLLRFFLLLVLFPLLQLFELLGRFILFFIGILSMFLEEASISLIVFETVGAFGEILLIEHYIL